MRHTILPAHLRRLVPAALLAACVSLAPAQSGLPLFFVPAADGYSLRQAGLGAYFGPRQVVLRVGGREVTQRFEGAARASRLEARGRQAGTVNYISGRRPEEWRTSIPASPTWRYISAIPALATST